MYYKTFGGANVTRYSDPSETVKGIQQLLISDKKKIGFLFGAGTSLSKKSNKSPTIPTITEMTSIIIEKIKTNSIYSWAIDDIIEDIKIENNQVTIEVLLTNISQKIAVIGKGTLNKLKKNELVELSELIKKEIINIISIHNNITEKSFSDMVQCDFAKWVKSANRKHGVEIFTTNYDYLFEIGFEHFNVPYYDGFTGSYKPFFNSDSLEDLNYLPQQTKLWKIHGSLGLHQELDTEKIVRSISNQEDLVIYPSSLKYTDCRKQPYTSFMDRLNLFLKQNDAVLFVCGYSFGDQHINERIVSALDSNTSAHVYVFNYDIYKDKDQNRFYSFLEDSPLAKIAIQNRKITVLSTRNVVIGSKYGTWKLKREPSNEDTININWYYDEDAPIETNIPLKVEKKGSENWTGEGELTITDFQKFTQFLLNMIPEARLNEQ